MAGKFTFDITIKLINKEIAYIKQEEKNMHKPFIHCFKTAKEYYVYDVNTDKIFRCLSKHIILKTIFGMKSGKRNRKANK